MASTRLVVVSGGGRGMEAWEGNGTGAGIGVAAPAELAGAGLSACGGAGGLSIAAGPDVVGAAAEWGNLSATGSGRRTQISNSAALTSTTAAPIHIH